MEMEQLYDVIVIGGGPAGLTAALYLARARYRVLVVEKEHFGGQITITNEIVNYPGVAKTSGRELTDTMRQQAEGFGAEFLLAEVTAFELDGDVKTVKTGRGEYRCFGVLLATGAHPRMIGFPGEAEFRGRGIAYCATCDGMLYRGREVAIVGGGNTAVGDALTLARLAGRVTLIHRRDALRASAVYLDKLRENGVNIVWNTEVKALQGDDRLTGLVLRNKVTGEESTLPVDGLFVAVGRRPETALFRGQLETDEAGYLIADETTRTSLPGVYAVGDVRRKPVRQILTAAADGAVAAHYIEEYLAGNRA